MAKTHRRILVALSDPHGGHQLGICAPGTIIKEYDEKGELYDKEVELNPAQEYLWNLLERGRKEVKKLAGKDQIDIFFGGDPINGNRIPHNNFTSSQSNQELVAANVLEPWLSDKAVINFRMASSTQLHINYEHSGDAGVERILRERHKNKNIRLVRHGKVRVGEVLVDFAHHGPRGESIRDWLDGNQLRLYMQDIFYKSLRNGVELPTLVLRGHVHTRVEEWLIRFIRDKKIKMIGCTLPSLQLLTAYAEMATKSEDWITNGIVAFEVVNGILAGEPIWLTETRDITSKENL